jgi:LacI family transcriptional regulator
VVSQFRKQESVPRFLLERNVDGVIIAGKINEKLIDYIDNLGLPMILVDYVSPKRRISSVLIDNRKGGHLAVQHLLDIGHREIGFIGGDITHPSIAERFLAYKETLVENGIAPNQQLIATNEQSASPENGANALGKMLEHGGRPTAVFVANDSMAIGCMQRVKQQGMKIPDDIAVVGFDDIESSSHVEPRLTTIKVPKEEMGMIAVQRLVDAVKTRIPNIVNTYVPVELVIRGSTQRTGAHNPSTPDRNASTAS